MKIVIKGIEIDLNEDEALGLLNDIRHAFGWIGTEFTRGDVETTMDMWKLTDEDWDKIQETDAWSRRMGEAMIEVGWDYISYAVEEAGL